MNTPICDFVRSYIEKNPVRLHMPGHKGENLLGFEAYDITEIKGADSLYEASGIIKESEENASRLFGSYTYYSTEGSSLAIRAMLYLACLYSAEKGEKPLVLAGRNAHKSFINTAALLGFDIEWIYPSDNETYLSCNITAKLLEDKLQSMLIKPTAVYITSPDYLGNMVDISAISSVCRSNNILLLVDNAHGAYLKFLSDSLHPMDNGADMCCDSAHKTLPVLTGGAYLHLSNSLPDFILSGVKAALGMFGSTSPSYLILQSLDRANLYLDSDFRSELLSLTSNIDILKKTLVGNGYELIGNEPSKITLNTKSYGYYGYDFAELLAEKGCICEYCDPDFVVLMFTPQNSEKLCVVKDLLLSVKHKNKICSVPLKAVKPEKITDVRTACFSCAEIVSVSDALNRVLASACVSCPPAVPVVVSGEKINENAIQVFKYYGIENCTVIK